MVAPRNRRHLLLPGDPAVESFVPYGRDIPSADVPVPASRVVHGLALKRDLESAVDVAEQRRTASRIEVHGAVPGIYVQFESQPGVRLNLKSLEDIRQGIVLSAVTHEELQEPEPRRIERATVFVPDGKIGHFIARFERYAQSTPKLKGERRHYDMIDRVATLRLATLRALWTDPLDTYPGEHEVIWWEVWLRRHDGRELERFLEFASLTQIDVGSRRIQFDDRIVTLVLATPRQLSTSIDVLNDLAEVRRAKETASVFEGMEPNEQADWADDLLRRTTHPGANAPAICILDTGVNRGHPLLVAALDVADCHACDPSWGIHDHHGHGTLMAGLALYGDLVPVLLSRDPIRLRHLLESVKILPPKGANPPELYGALTAEAVGRVEIQAPARRRYFSLAVTTTDSRDIGEPTSWSAAIDALAAGRTFDPTNSGLVYLDDGSESQCRLFIVSAGNVEELEIAHLDRSDVEPVHDPAQAWNALTIGAFTDKVLIHLPDWAGWQPVAPAGDLSPWSTTSVSFADRWPIKPDVVFEGGNAVRNSADEVDFPCEDLCLLSTHHIPSERHFSLSWATSAATAQAARLAATISAEYPALWPETVRGLIVHSAEWTRRMHAYLKGAGDSKRARARLIRRYGFGVPQPERALRSANDSLTLMSQAVIQPFAKGKMRDMHLYDLPWPHEVLEGLGAEPVQLRVTLSYFIEPNPGRRGWRERHRYASHGLRFEVKGPTESIDEFRKRLNRRALETDESRPTSGADSSGWFLGEQARNKGSLHSDILQGFAADIAQRGVIAVYPVSGWWKDQPARDRSELGVRYSLIVSIETAAADVDIWTPVAMQVGIPIEVTV